MTEKLVDDYGLSKTPALVSTEAPALDYKPRDPRTYRPAIGLIGCGGISVQHLNAYKTAGYRVVALCSRTENKARERQQQFYPEASIYTDYRELLSRDDIEVVDIATHPAERVAIMEDALRARKHVLSQKPFVLDLDTGERLADLAEAQRVKLAVNQNARWAPHFSYIR
ncbi:MAG: Gfo/Idh/MocA family oxidoreductase, partial [Pyrinomonadaceae bacterium]|nr:Gfo/Idh/MocA family oxidoreductase [Pyrinomonadaceae bacterium]